MYRVSTSLPSKRTLNTRSADFPVCRIAGFLTGICRGFPNHTDFLNSADWKVGDTADKNVCATWIALLFLLLLLPGCSKPVPDGALIVCQTLVSPNTSFAAGDVLDVRYPPGSRVIATWPPFGPNQVRVLSRGLIAAGSPGVSSDGQHVYFIGKTSIGGNWQVFQTSRNGGSPEQITHVEEGAMDPALLPNGDWVFSSPAPKLGQAWKPGSKTELYAQSPGGKPRQLTFGPNSATDPVVLSDGRILFITAQPLTIESPGLRLGLFTINNDGTEFSAFAGQHEGMEFLHRPRELYNGRIAFLSATNDLLDARAHAQPEFIRTARPMASRAPLFSFGMDACRCIEPALDGKDSLLACLPVSGPRNYGVFLLSTNASALGNPIVSDPLWNAVEAVALTVRPKPRGHISTMISEEKSGTILCLDAHWTTYAAGKDSISSRAVKIRVLTLAEDQTVRTLGEVPLQPDGSFMADVPPDRPIGFEALDAQSGILRRVPPTIWVRPGENRICLGCHEPHNRSPKNIRPQAVNIPPANLANPGKAAPAAPSTKTATP